MNLYKIPALILAGVLTLAAKCHVSLPRTSGQASFYGDAFVGKKTTNGEKYDPYDMTCASNLYPMNTKLRVYYPRKKKEVIVRVNDRGPNVPSRSIDLSYAAAYTLGLIPDGVGYVLITPICQ